MREGVRGPQGLPLAARDLFGQGGRNSDTGSGSPAALTSRHLATVCSPWWGAGWECPGSAPLGWLQRKHSNGPERAREECGPHSPWGLEDGWE